MVPYSSIFHSSWSPVAPKGGKLVSEAWKIRWVFPTSILSYTFARLLLPLQGSDTSATCPFPRGWQVTNPLKTPDSSLTQFSTSDKERNQDTLLSPSPPEMEVTLSLSLSLPRKHHISKPRQWQTAKCRFSTFCNISWLTHQHNGAPPLRKIFWLPRSIYSQRWRELPFSPLTKLSRSSQDQQQASVHSLQICRVCLFFFFFFFMCGLL